MQLKGEVTTKSVEEYKHTAGDFSEARRRGTVQVRCPSEDNDGAQTVFNVTLDGKAAAELDSFSVGQRVTITIGT